MTRPFIGCFEELIGMSPYGVSQAKKERLLLMGIRDLCDYHAEHCEPYHRILSGFWPNSKGFRTLSDAPYLPVSLFKSQPMMSVASDQVRTTLTSSGTSGQSVSQIYLDADTSARQQRALANSLGYVLGPKRLPMLVMDSPAVFKDPRLLSARGAGVLGIMRYGREHAFALDAGMAPDIKAVRSFLERHGSQPFFMFGFTYLVWLEFYERFKDEGLDLSNGILIHSGGWKRMIDKAVSPERFKRDLSDKFRLTQVFNFYGMVEQIGTLFLEGLDGLLYPPNFADVIIRNADTWEECPVGEPGVIQVLSLLPSSYPGHSLLTEDMGVVEAVDSGRGGRLGKGIRVLGRVPKAELRGCSDVIAAGS